MAKVFMSILGTNPYVEVYYQLGEKKSLLTPFIQEALLQLTRDEWNKEDRLVFFLTQDARRKNWDDGGNFEKGLGSRLKDLSLSAQIIPVNLKEGHSEEEIAENFLAIVDQLKEGDEVVFDITHSFRSLPMLNLVALNYAKVLKGIQIKAIYYGAFEVLGPLPAVKEMPENERIAPVFDLTRYAKLLDWTFAVDDFVHYGMVERLHELVKDRVTPILKETKGRDENARRLREFSNNLQDLAMNISTCRGQNILGFNWGEKLDLPALEGTFLPAFVPLLEKIEEKIEGFKSDDHWSKAKAAVKWCIDHKMVQQGYTILLESVITEVGVLMGLKDMFTDKGNREFVSQLLSATAQKMSPDIWRGELNNRKNEALEWQKQGGEPLKRLAGAFGKLVELRNDINHCGFRGQPRRPDKILRELSDCFKRVDSSLKDLRNCLRNE